VITFEPETRAVEQEPKQLWMTGAGAKAKNF